MRTRINIWLWRRGIGHSPTGSLLYYRGTLLRPGRKIGKYANMVPYIGPPRWILAESWRTHANTHNEETER